MIKPKYSTDDLLLDNNGITIFQVVDITEYGDYPNTKHYAYTLKNLTIKGRYENKIDEYIIEQNTTRLSSSAAAILFGTKTAKD